MTLRKFYIFLLFLSIFHLGHAQDSLKTEKKEKGLIVLPVIFFSPETSLGFGAADIIYFRAGKKPSTKPSSIQNVFVYTLENQILFQNPFNVFLNEDKNWMRGELSYFNFPYEYYGIGSDISLDSAESYDAEYLRLELAWLKKHRNLYIGPAVFFDSYLNINTIDNGQLEQQRINGIQGGNVFGFGINVIWDRRNNLFCPQAGFYLEGQLTRYEEKLIGDYPFTNLVLDARKYINAGESWEVGLQLYHQSVMGQPPFYNLARLGGSKQMRGYFNGAYRDHHQTVLQTEVRRYLLKRVVGSVFGGVGAVATDFGQYNHLLPSYGIGLRYEIDPKEKIRIRLDYAWGQNTQGFYININEAF
ncbi:MAG: BamA/TamA family outer membrane protein [Cyclobacteriaceae bacterium]